MTLLCLSPARKLSLQSFSDRTSVAPFVGRRFAASGPQGHIGGTDAGARWASQERHLGLLDDSIGKKNIFRPIKYIVQKGSQGGWSIRVIELLRRSGLRLSEMPVWVATIWSRFCELAIGFFDHSRRAAAIRATLSIRNTYLLGYRIRRLIERESTKGQTMERA